MDISIIIPLFNAKKFLERCVKSVALALKNFDGKCEIVIIDNGSTDGSYKLAEKLAKDNSLICLSKCPVAGAAAVRNFGILEAKGKYVWFVDADDEVKPNSVTSLMKKAEETTADLVMMGATRVYTDGHTDYLSAVKPEEPNYKSRFVRYGAGPWQFLIRRKWWLEHGFKFREGIIHEDMEIISSLILYTENFSAVDEPLYIYYQNDDSVLHKKKWDPHYLDIFEALEGLYKRFEVAGMVDKYRGELEWFFIWNLLIDSAKDFAKFTEGRGGFERSREMLKKYFPTWRKNKFLRQKSFKLRIRVQLNYFKK